MSLDLDASTPESDEGICWHRNNFSKSRESLDREENGPEFLKVTLKRAAGFTRHHGAFIESTEETSNEKISHPRSVSVSVDTRKRKELFQGRSTNGALHESTITDTQSAKYNKGNKYDNLNVAMDYGDTTQGKPSLGRRDIDTANLEDKTSTSSYSEGMQENVETTLLQSMDNSIQTNGNKFDNLNCVMDYEDGTIEKMATGTMRAISDEAYSVSHGLINDQTTCVTDYGEGTKEKVETGSLKIIDGTQNFSVTTGERTDVKCMMDFGDGTKEKLEDGIMKQVKRGTTVSLSDDVELDESLRSSSWMTRAQLEAFLRTAVAAGDQKTLDEIASMATWIPKGKLQISLEKCLETMSPTATKAMMEKATKSLTKTQLQEFMMESFESQQTIGSVEMAMKFKSQDEIMASMAEMRQGMRRDEVERFVGVSLPLVTRDTLEEMFNKTSRAMSQEQFQSHLMSSSLADTTEPTENIFKCSDETVAKPHSTQASISALKDELQIEDIKLGQTSAISKDESAVFRSELSAFMRESSAFKEESLAFKQESSVFQQESKAFKQETSQFRQEASAFKQASLAFKKESSAFKQESSGFKQESSGFKQESIAFKENSAAFKQESFAFKEKSSAFREQSSSFSHEAKLFKEESTSFKQASQAFQEQVLSTTAMQKESSDCDCNLKSAVHLQEIASLKEDLASYRSEKSELRQKEMISLMETAEAHQESAVVNEESIALKEERIACKEASVALKEATLALKGDCISLKEEATSKKEQSVGLQQNSATRTEKSTVMKEMTTFEKKESTGMRENSANLAVAEVEKLAVNHEFKRVQQQSADNQLSVQQSTETHPGLPQSTHTQQSLQQQTDEQNWQHSAQTQQSLRESSQSQKSLKESSQAHHSLNPQSIAERSTIMKEMSTFEEMQSTGMRENSANLAIAEMENLEVNHESKRVQQQSADNQISVQQSTNTQISSPQSAHQQNWQHSTQIQQSLEESKTQQSLQESSKTQQSVQLSSQTQQSVQLSTQTQQTEQLSSQTQKSEQLSSQTQKSEQLSSQTQKSEQLSSQTQKSEHLSSQTQKSEQLSSQTQKSEQLSSQTQKSEILSSQTHKSEQLSSQQSVQLSKQNQHSLIPHSITGSKENNPMNIRNASYESENQLSTINLSSESNSIHQQQISSINEVVKENSESYAESFKMSESNELRGDASDVYVRRKKMETKDSRMEMEKQGSRDHMNQETENAITSKERTISWEKSSTSVCSPSDEDGVSWHHINYAMTADQAAKQPEFLRAKLRKTSFGSEPNVR